MAALLKDDCEDGYVVHVIDKAAKDLSYDSIKELQRTHSHMVYSIQARCLTVT